MTATETTTTVVVPGTHLMASLVGPRDQHLRQIEAAFPETDIYVRGNEVVVRGEQAGRVAQLFEELVGLLQRGHELDEPSLRRVIGMVDEDERPSEILTQDVLRGAGVVRSVRSRPDRSGTSTPSPRTSSRSASGLPVPASPGSLWRWRCARCKPRKCSGSS